MVKGEWSGHSNVPLDGQSFHARSCQWPAFGGRRRLGTVTSWTTASGHRPRRRTRYLEVSGREACDAAWKVARRANRSHRPPATGRAMTRAAMYF